ncbi:MAG: hypothetical protein HYX53_12025 [Chloroflexi bacterium]|nr:hypothetical protein [Chloroflexota bacterium]
MTPTVPGMAMQRLQPALALLRANAAEADRSGTLPRENVAALRAAGAFRWSLSKALGGDELGATEKVDLAAALGRADLCTFWIFGNYDSHTWDLSGHNAEPWPGAHALLAAETAFCGTVAPIPGSVADGDELVINGRFGFITGWRDATWMRANVLLPGPAPEAPADSTSRFHLRVAHIPLDRPEVTIEKTWDAVGLRASQTDTAVIEGLRIPYANSTPYTFDPVRLAPDFGAPSPAYREPGWALSNARLGAALAGCGMEAFDRAVEYTAGGAANQTGQAPARFPGVRACMADAYIELAAALAAQRGTAAASDRRAALCEPWTAADEAAVWGMGAATTQAVLRAVEQLALALGGTGAQRSLPFERHFRDIRTGAMHLGVHPNLVRDRVNAWLFPGLK